MDSFASELGVPFISRLEGQHVINTSKQVKTVQEGDRIRWEGDRSDTGHVLVRSFWSLAGFFQCCGRFYSRIINCVSY